MKVSKTNKEWSKISSNIEYIGAEVKMYDRDDGTNPALDFMDKIHNKLDVPLNNEPDKVTELELTDDEVKILDEDWL